MKKENVQNTSEKRSVNDFEHRMTIQLTEQHYIDYAMAHSQDQIKKGRQRAILWAVLFTVVGCVAIYRGAFMEGWMSEIYLVAGVLMNVFQLFNLFYNFVMFPIALRHSVSKELKKDTSLLEPMEYAFEPDKIVCFLNGRHRSTTLCSEIFEVEKNDQTLVLKIKNGKRIIIPKTALEQADPVIREQVAALGK